MQLCKKDVCVVKLLLKTLIPLTEHGI